MARWIDGQQLTGATLWGHPLFVWGRWGKALQFLAGLTVLLDLVGPEPLRAFGGRLSGISWPKLHSRGHSVLAVILWILAGCVPVGGLIAATLAFMERTGRPVPRFPQVPARGLRDRFPAGPGATCAPGPLVRCGVVPRRVPLRLPGVLSRRVSGR